MVICCLYCLSELVPPMQENSSSAWFTGYVYREREILDVCLRPESLDTSFTIKCYIGADEHIQNGPMFFLKTY